MHQQNDAILFAMSAIFIVVGGAYLFRPDLARKAALWKLRHSSAFSRWLDPFSSEEAIASSWFRILTTVGGIVFTYAGLLMLWFLLFDPR